MTPVGGELPKISLQTDNGGECGQEFEDSLPDNVRHRGWTAE